MLRPSAGIVCGALSSVSSALPSAPLPLSATATSSSASFVPLCSAVPSFRPSPRSCYHCPLFSTCLKHTSHAPLSLGHALALGGSVPESSPSAAAAGRLLGRRTIGTLAKWSGAVDGVANERRSRHVGTTVTSRWGTPSKGKGKGKAVSLITTRDGAEGSSLALVGAGDSQARMYSSRNTPTTQQDTIDTVSEEVRKPARPRKQVISLTPMAVEHLAQLLEGPDPKMIRVGVKNKGCAGMSYHLSYVDAVDKFDEVVEEPHPSRPKEKVKVIIDSRALFSVIGSEMDWEEGRMGSRFIFRNPNVKEQCGCGESFMV